jgi:toxin HigB-1
MDVEFADDELREMYTNPKYKGRYSQPIVRSFRKRIQFIVAAPDERDLYAWRSLHFEKLEGRGEQRSIRLNKQWRLIVELVGEGAKKALRVLGIEDYH